MDIVWNKPEIVEIKMDAEIGSYHEDRGDEAPPVSNPDHDPVHGS